MASPWLPVAVLAGALAFFASARGFQQGDAIPVIACTSTAANVTCIAGGILVFGDALAGGACSLVQIAAFAVVAAASLLTPTGRVATPPASGATAALGSAAVASAGRVAAASDAPADALEYAAHGPAAAAQVVGSSSRPSRPSSTPSSTRIGERIREEIPDFRRLPAETLAERRPRQRRRAR